MIRSRGIEDKMRRQRADAKTLDNLFRRRIEAGANCSPFVSKAILQTAKEVFPLDPQHVDNQLGLGQVRLLVVAAHEPAIGGLLQQPGNAALLPQLIEHSTAGSG